MYLKKDGVVVDEYTTDKQYNGAFVFKGVEPGTYTIEVENPDFAPCTPVEVTVKAAEIAYPSIFIDNYSLMAPEGEFTDYPDEVAGLVVAPESYTFVVFRTCPMSRCIARKYRQEGVSRSFFRKRRSRMPSGCPGHRLSSRDVRKNRNGSG